MTLTVSRYRCTLDFYKRLVALGLFEGTRWNSPRATLQCLTHLSLYFDCLYGVMLMMGPVIGVAIEWVAVHVLERWAYTAWMPLVPGLDVGIVPVVQMLVLPPLIFRGVAVWRNRTATPE